NIRGQLQSAFKRDDAYLLTLRADQADLTGPDLIVDAWFDADVASSSRYMSATDPKNVRAPAYMPRARSTGLCSRSRHGVAAGTRGSHVGRHTAVCRVGGRPEPGNLVGRGWERVLRLGLSSGSRLTGTPNRVVDASKCTRIARSLAHRVPAS